MGKRSHISPWVIGPVCLAGLVVCSLILAPSRDIPTSKTVEIITPAEEASIVDQAMREFETNPSNDSLTLAQAERKLLLRRNDDPRRRLEIAAGLYAIASRHLELAQAPEAMRVGQLAADLAPDSLVAARSWMLCGRASAVTHPDLPLSIRYYERAESTIRHRLRQHPFDTTARQARASAILWLGQNEDRFQRTEQAIGHLRMLVDDSPEARAQPPADRLRAMLTLGTLLKKTGSIAEGEKFLVEGVAYGLSDQVRAVEALHTLVESARSSATDPLDPARIDSLRVLWETPRFEDLPEWFQIGDELASADFFRDPPRTADFELVSRKLLNRLPILLQSTSPDSEERESYESIYATQLLLAAESARRRDDRSDVERLVSLFERTFQGRDVKFITPLDRPAQRLSQLGEIYRTTMIQHVEQLKQFR